MKKRATDTVQRAVAQEATAPQIKKALDEQLKAMKLGMRQYHHALRELAK